MFLKGFSSGNIFISFLIFFPSDSFRNELFNLHEFTHLLGTHGIISIFLCLLKFPFCSQILSILKKLPWLLSRIYILWHLGDIFCRKLSDPFDMSFILKFLCFLPRWPIYWGKHSIEIAYDWLCVNLCINFTNMLFMKLSAPVFGAYMLYCHISLTIDPLSRRKSILSNIRVAIPAWFLMTFAGIFLSILLL